MDLVGIYRNDDKFGGRMLFSLLHFMSSDYVVGITGHLHGGPGLSATSIGNLGR